MFLLQNWDWALKISKAPRDFLQLQVFKLGCPSYFKWGGFSAYLLSSLILLACMFCFSFHLLLHTKWFLNFSIQFFRFLICLGKERRLSWKMFVSCMTMWCLMVISEVLTSEWSVPLTQLGFWNLSVLKLLQNNKIRVLNMHEGFFLFCLRKSSCNFPGRS